MTKTEEIRATSRTIMTCLVNKGKTSIRKIANLIGVSKSSVQRHLHSRKKRQQYPESPFWESPQGEAWLHRLVFAVLYDLGLGCNIGADRLCIFFNHLRIDTHVGVSANSLRTLMREMEQVLPEFQEMCEAQAVHETDKIRRISATGDETFFGDTLMLVFMDLFSGYLLVEDIADNRRFDTWLAAVKTRLVTLNIEVEHFVSDRAKALIKLATDGLGCESGADLFHAQQILSRQLGKPLKRRTHQVYSQIKAGWKRLSVLFKKSSDSQDIDAIDAEANKIIELNQTKACLRRDNKTYDNCLKAISTAVHPFNIDTQKQQSTQDVEVTLTTQIEKLKQIENQHFPEKKNKATKNFRKQLQALALCTDVWWYFVLNSLLSSDLSADEQDWMLNTLLPVVYWHEQMKKTKEPWRRKRYKKAWEAAAQTCQPHPLTTRFSNHHMDKHLQWATWVVGHFHRSSSAVEGRNGTLSQMYHNRRGLTPTRLKALTVLANYEQRGLDGKTSAERLFETSFSDMFEWVLGEMGALPLPRNRVKKKMAKPLNLQKCPALSW